MQKLLLHLDTSTRPSVFDRVVAYDSGADQVLSYGGVSPHEVRELVHGTLFTRGLDELHHTAVFIGGTDLGAGERLLTAVHDAFFGPFRVSVMLDSNGANTTAVAAVTRVREAIGALAGSRAVVLAGSGPVGARVAGLLVREGAQVTVTSRRNHEGSLAATIAARFGAAPTERVVTRPDEVTPLLAEADIVISAGPAGVSLVPRAAWVSSPARVLVDLNAAPPAGIEGVGPTDKATPHGDTIAFGALGVGSLKMRVHKASIAHLFARNDVTLDVESIAALAATLATPRR